MKPPTKTAETAEERLLGGVEQVVAPPDRVAHRLLSQGQIPRAAAEQRQPLFQALQQRRRGQGLDARRGQLDRQREAIEPAHDFGHRRQRLGGQAEIGPDGLRALDEELDRAGRPGVLDAWSRCVSGSGATGNSCSPETRSLIRLVISTVTPGQASRDRAPVVPR